MVERGPEKAGVGGSIPSLAHHLFNNLAAKPKYYVLAVRTMREHRAFVRRFQQFPHLTRRVAGSGDMLPPQLRVAFGHLDVRVTKYLGQLVQITAIHHLQDAKV